MNGQLTEEAASQELADRGHKHPVVRVIVSYAAAVRPYRAEVAGNTTIGQVKTAVLVAFKLTETATKTFKLFHGHTELTNLGETVSQVARGHKELALKLEEVIVQG